MIDRCCGLLRTQPVPEDLSTCSIAHAHAELHMHMQNCKRVDVNHMLMNPMCLLMCLTGVVRFMQLGQQSPATGVSVNAAE